MAKTTKKAHGGAKATKAHAADKASGRKKALGDRWAGFATVDLGAELREKCNALRDKLGLSISEQCREALPFWIAAGQPKVAAEKKEKAAEKAAKAPAPKKVAAKDKAAKLAAKPENGAKPLGTPKGKKHNAASVAAPKGDIVQETVRKANAVLAAESAPAAS